MLFFQVLRWHHVMLLSSLLSASVHAVTPITSSSLGKAFVTPPASPSSCTKACNIYDITTVYQWTRITSSTTITAATEVVIVDEATNKTLTTTLIRNSLPSDFEKPSVNEEGTHIRLISYTGLDEKLSRTAVTWPTPFFNHPADYYWKGTLPTAIANGSQACLSTPFYTSRPYPAYSTTQWSVDKKDYSGSVGTDYALVSATLTGYPDHWRNFEDIVLQSCDLLSDGNDTGPGGYGDYWPKPNALVSAKYLTVTSTSTSRRKASDPTIAAAPVPPPKEGEVYKGNAAATPPYVVASAPAAVQTKSWLVPEVSTNPTAAPTLSIGGEKYTAITTIGTAGPAYVVAAQTLRVDSTITLGSGSAAQTIALKTDAHGALVVESASAGTTRTSTVGSAPALGSADNARKDGHVSPSKTATGKVALQTVNKAGRMQAEFLLTLAIVVTLGMLCL